MSWADQGKQGFISLASSTGTIRSGSLEIESFIIHHGDTKILKKLIDKFLLEIDDCSLVDISIEEEKNREIRYGERRPFYFFVDISVFNEDLENIDTDKPTRMMVKTNVFPNNKDYFVKFFENFSKVCGW